jgi:ankyrin repeat protein
MPATPFQLNAMREAIAVGDEKKVCLLLAAGVSPLDGDAEGLPFLLDAIQHRHLNIVKLLVAEGADVRQRGLMAHTLKPRGEHGPSREIAMFLASGQPLPQSEMDAGLRMAQSAGFEDVASMLISYGAMPVKE